MGGMVVGSGERCRETALVGEVCFRGHPGLDHIRGVGAPLKSASGARPSAAAFARFSPWSPAKSTSALGEPLVKTATEGTRNVAPAPRPVVAFGYFRGVDLPQSGGGERRQVHASDAVFLFPVSILLSAGGAVPPPAGRGGLLPSSGESDSLNGGDAFSSRDDADAPAPPPLPPPVAPSPTDGPGEPAPVSFELRACRVAFMFFCSRKLAAVASPYSSLVLLLARPRGHIHQEPPQLLLLGRLRLESHSNGGSSLRRSLRVGGLEVDRAGILQIDTTAKPPLKFFKTRTGHAIAGEILRRCLTVRLTLVVGNADATSAEATTTAPPLPAASAAASTA